MLELWRTVWTVVLAGGLTLFAVLSIIITIQGGRDLLSMLRGLEHEKHDARRQ